MTKHGRSAIVSWVSAVLLFTSVGMNALQAKRIKELVEPTVAASRVGQRAVPITGLDLSGRRRTVDFTQAEPTVVYFFSPSCKWCEENWVNVRALANASNGNFRFVAVAGETELAGFARGRGLEFEIIGGISPEIRKAFGFSGTPHTVVVSSQGEISREWAGAFSGRRQRLVEAYFDITLPGLERESEAR